MRHDILCQSPNHEARRNQPGWAATLGFVDSDDPNFDNVAYSQGLFCEACGVEVLTPEDILSPVTADVLDTLVEKAKAVQDGTDEFTGEEISSIMTDYLASRANRP